MMLKKKSMNVNPALQRKNHKENQNVFQLHKNIFSSETEHHKENSVYASTGISPFRKRSENSSQQSLFMNNSSVYPLKNPKRQAKAQRVLTKGLKENISCNMQLPLFQKTHHKWKGQVVTPKGRLNTQPDPDYFQICSEQSEKYAKKDYSGRVGSSCSTIEDISFKNLIQNRCKTPISALNRPKIEINKTTNGKSRGEEKLFHSVFRKKDSMNKTGRKQGECTSVALCCNNDGKQAKYRVISEEELEKDLIYCSRCTIALVQQGFILEELNSAKLNKQRNVKEILRHKKHVEQCLKQIGSSRQEELNKLNAYYDSVIQVVDSFRMDDQSILENKFCQLQNYLWEGLDAIESFVTSLDNKEHEQLLSKINQVEIFISQFEKKLPSFAMIQSQSIQKFAQIFEAQYRPKFRSKDQSATKMSSRQTQGYLPQLHAALRFSFEKTGTIKEGKVQSLINPSEVQLLEEEDLQSELEYSNSEVLPGNSGAFRNLFPEEDARLKGNVSSPTFKNI